MTFERTIDYDLIKQIVTHSKIWPHITDDFSGKPEDFNPIQHESAFYLLVKEEREVLGVFALYPKNRICWEVHTCLLPTAWGKRARHAAKDGMRWIFEHTECLRLITDVPEYNVLALRFAHMAGMTQFGINPKSYMKNGKLHDVTMLGISKTEAK